MHPFDLETTDRLLSTTRAVRKRLDLDRAVEPETVHQCLELALQAPSGSNKQGWHWVVVTDPARRAALADLYRRGFDPYHAARRRQLADGASEQDLRVLDSARYLRDVLDRVPVHVVPCIEAEVPENAPPRFWIALMGSIFPAVWSFQLALRARGLGSVLTTLHLGHADEAAALLGIPRGVVQAGLVPVAYTLGTEFRPARRRPLDDVVHRDGW